MIDLENRTPWLTSHELADFLHEPVELIWRWAREGTGPVEPLRIGARSIRWPTAKVLRALGLDTETPAPSQSVEDGEGPAPTPTPADDHRELPRDVDRP